MATPVMHMAKPKKTIHICGVYKAMVRLDSGSDNYAFPQREDLLAGLHG